MNQEPLDNASNPSGGRPGNRNGGGVFIALGAILGAIGGGLMGQPSAGLLAGLVLGIAAALLIWWKGR